MAWTTPKTWSNEVLTSADMNTHIRDNLDALKTPPSAIYEAVEGSDLSGLNSTSFADVDATEGKFQHTVTTGGGDVLIIASIPVGVSGTLSIYLDVMIDGTAYGVTTLGAADGLFSQLITATAATVETQLNFVRYIPASSLVISAGLHVFKLRYKVSASAATFYRAAGTANADIPAQFVVREVS